VTILTETQTRKTLIDPVLKRAGWDANDSNQVGTEVPVDGFDPAAWKVLEAKVLRLRKTGVPYEVGLPKGICDYMLYRPNGEIVDTIVEAKSTIIDPRLAEAQAEFYVAELAKRRSFRRFAFLTNGRDVYFWDVGQAHKRLVAGLFSPQDLENLLYVRQNGTPLTAVPINARISDRAYRQEAVRRVCQTFDQGRRWALIVMATGTGETRVVI